MKRKPEYVLAAVFLFIYSIVAFLPPFAHGVSFWVGYGFGMLAILWTFVLTSALFRKGRLSSTASLIFFIWAIFGIQIAIGVLCMAIPGIPLRFALLLNLLALAAGILVRIAAAVYCARAAGMDERASADRAAWQDMSLRLQRARTLSGDKRLSSELGELCEAVRFSDPVGTPDTRKAEEMISDNIRLLETLTGEHKYEEALELCAQVGRALQERNQRCRQGK